MGVAEKRERTYAEYLALEATSEQKHEFLAGHVWAMAGGTIEHGALAATAARLLGNALEGRPCRVLSSDVRVRATGLATYPDVSVVCGRIETHADDPNGVTNPILLVEVLSASTAAYDRGTKAMHYRRIDSLREILFIDPDTRLIELNRKNDRGAWEIVDIAGDGRIELRGLGIELDAGEIFRDPLTTP